MSTESEAIQNSTEQENGKRQGMIPEEADKRPRHNEESAARYHSNGSTPQPHPMMYRHTMEPLMMRPTMPRSISPRGPPAEDNDLTDAMIFLNRIKEEFNDNLHVYDNFLETMRDFRFEKIDADEVCKAIRILFKDKPHLIRLFDEYLPHHLRYSDMNNRGGYEMQMGEGPKNMGFRGGPGFIPKPPTPIHMGGMPPSSAMHMNRMGHQMPHSSFAGRTIRQSPPPQMGVPLDAQQRFKNFVAQPLPQSPRHKTAHDFVQQVKKRYMNKPLVYRQFVELLQNSKNSFEKLYTQVNALLSDSPDLIEKFEKNFKTPNSPDEIMYTHDADPLRQIKQKLAEQGNLELFLKVINFYNQNYISSEDLVNLVEPLIEDKDNLVAFKSFIKYEEIIIDGEPNKYKGLKKMGSYKLLPVPILITTSTSTPKEVLNNLCVCVATQESEDDTYIFRNKNHSEDLLCRIIDERSEADLVMGRLKFLIVQLEEIYESVEDGELDLHDIKMSSSLVKETLRSVYDNKSSEILESILTNPKKAIPIILKRLNKVLKENLERLREFKKFWREIAEEHYYKAYDTQGVLFRSQEKNYLSLRNVEIESRTPLSFKIQDSLIFSEIRNFFKIFTKNHSSNNFKKPSLESQLEIFDSAISEITGLNTNNVNSSLNNTNNNINGIASKTVDFDTYALYYYILILYSRFEEIKSLKLPPISSNPMAVSLSLQEEFNIIDRYSEIIKAANDLMSKQIEADRFEDILRRMTDSKGYKLYNFKKIIAKIEKQINVLLEGGSEEVEEADNEEMLYTIQRNGDIVTIVKEIKEEEELSMIKE